MNTLLNLHSGRFDSATIRLGVLLNVLIDEVADVLMHHLGLQRAAVCRALLSMSVEVSLHSLDYHGVLTILKQTVGLQQQM